MRRFGREIARRLAALACALSLALATAGLAVPAGALAALDDAPSPETVLLDDGATPEAESGQVGDDQPQEVPEGTDPSAPEGQDPAGQQPGEPAPETGDPASEQPADPAPSEDPSDPAEDPGANPAADATEDLEADPAGPEATDPAADDPAADVPEDEAELEPEEALPSVTYRAYVQGGSWQGWRADGETAGTSGQSLRIEGVQLKLENAPEGSHIEYRAHVQGEGWQGWVRDGKSSGLPGKGRRLEAVRVRLVGPIADEYDVYVRCHVQSVGWTRWAKNGALAGTEGIARRVEAIQVTLVPKGDPAPSSDDEAPPQVFYRGHVQTYGWQDWVKGGSSCGTTGKSKRVEALNIRLANADGGITYQAHVQGVGWQGWRSDGELAGTSGQARRVEAIRIKLTGKVAEEYDVYYRVHAQHFGWMAWAKNGEPCGTEGFSYRLEAVQVRLVRKGGSAPANASGATQSFIAPPTVQYRSAVEGGGWQGWVSQGSTSGTVGEATPVNSVQIRVPDGDGRLSGSISYRVYVQGAGWRSWASDGANAGTPGSGKRVEALQIKLSGRLAQEYDVWYRAYCQGYGWLGWAKNGASVGTNGMGYRLEAYQVRLVRKGGSAPGSTSRSFMNATVNKTGYQNPEGYYQVSSTSVILTPAAYRTAHCYVTPSRISASASREDCVNAFIARAREYLGTPYVWNWSRQPGVGVDCIGLVYQCAYACGMDMGRGTGQGDFNPYAHWVTGAQGWHSHDANNFWNLGKAKHVSVADRRRGDVIYWPGHVAIYIGNDRIIEAFTGKVEVASLWAHGTPTGCIRLFQ